jgi:hypothetical protein
LGGLEISLGVIHLIPDAAISDFQIGDGLLRAIYKLVNNACPRFKAITITGG